MNVYSFQKWLPAIIVSLLLISSCTKTEDPPRKVGEELPYPAPAKTLGQLLDSLPDCTMYNAMYKRSGLKPYIDSANGKNPNTPFTLFVPTDKALSAAGYTMDIINAAAPTILDSVVRYLALSGNYRTDPHVPSGTTIFTLMQPDPNLVRTTMPTVFSAYQPYVYLLTPDFQDNALWLNGKKVSSTTTPLSAINGCLYRIDSLVQKPFYEMYQLINTDTTLSYYIAALRINDSLYQAKGIIGSMYSNIQYNDTLGLMLAPADAGQAMFEVLLAPTNNAFRKAGFQSIDDIRTYINNSALASSPGGTQMLTNLDSVLSFHQLLYGYYSTFGWIGQGAAYIYTCDMLNNPYMAQLWVTGVTPRVSLNNVFFQDAGGRIAVRRIDAPTGRAAVITSNSDIPTLNGVLHHVDDLLLPNP
ncbi:MAG: hypothetical protein J0H74_23445 [Chitinophagaceae bacterium]|nr:hypothetical protein [Chitinophagaceae bacterium]